MKMLLVTNSARGEAIAEAIKRSASAPELCTYSSVRSPGLLRMSSELMVGPVMDFPAIIAFAERCGCAWAFIAPDDPIGGGLVDVLAAVNIPCIAPTKALARIEASKGFARSLMEKYNIDANPLYRRFDTSSTRASIEMFIREDLREHYVVKYDALRGGKGVKVSGEHLASIDEGVAYALECIQECGSVVIEEKLIGVEFSLLSFVSGHTAVDMPAIQDHKRAHEGDTGPNTGGMGTISDANHSLPFLRSEDISRASELNHKVAHALAQECAAPYKGILYGGFIATANGVKVIEYNARFGDPEVLNILPLLRSDFVSICQAIIDGTLTKDMVEFDALSTVCKYITPNSYPEGKNEVGQPMIVPTDIPQNVRVYYGDVEQDATGTIRLRTSRAVGVVGIGATIAAAERAAEDFCQRIQGPVRHRKDIGKAALIAERIATLQRLRG